MTSRRFGKWRERRSRVEKDVRRTDRAQAYYRKKSNVRQLQNVLLSYAMYNFDLGYVQVGCTAWETPTINLYSDPVHHRLQRGLISDSLDRVAYWSSSAWSGVSAMKHFYNVTGASGDKVQAKILMLEAVTHEQAISQKYEHAQNIS